MKKLCLMLVVAAVALGGCGAGTEEGDSGHEQTGVTESALGTSSDESPVASTPQVPTTPQPWEPAEAPTGGATEAATAQGPETTPITVVSGNRFSSHQGVNHLE